MVCVQSQTPNFSSCLKMYAKKFDLKLGEVEAKFSVLTPLNPWKLPNWKFVLFTSHWWLLCCSPNVTKVCNFNKSMNLLEIDKKTFHYHCTPNQCILMGNFHFFFSWIFQIHRLLTEWISVYYNRTLYRLARRNKNYSNPKKESL